MRSRSAAALSLLLLLLTACTLTSSAAAQNFAQPTIIPTGNSPTGNSPAAIYTVDINGDGFPDLIYIDAGATPAASTTHVLLNDGHGNFAQSAVIPTAGNSLAIGDYLGLGQIDINWLTAANNNIFVHVAHGKGDGTFPQSTIVGPITLPTQQAKPIQFGFLTMGRLHSHTPGGLDLIAVDVNNSVVYATWAQSPFPSRFETGYGILPDGPGPVAVADFNGDGNNDLVVNSLAAASAQVLLGTFTGLAKDTVALPSFTGLTGIHSLIVAPFSNTGRADLLTEGALGNLDIFFGKGDGTFLNQSAGGTTPGLDGTTGNGGHLIALAPLAGHLGAITSTPAGISSLLSNNTAYLGLKGIYNAGPGRSSYAVADFNRDGNPDLAVDSPEGIAILFGDSTGGFQTNQAFASTKPALSSTNGVFTGSGNTDFVVDTALTQGQFLQGKGDGTFLPAVPTSPQSGVIPTNPALFSTVQSGDFNGDGKLDLAFTATGLPLPGTGSGLFIAYGNGDGTFQPPVPVPNPAGNAQNTLFGFSVPGDFNGDGVSDLANTDSFFSDTLLGTRGQSSGQFAPGLQALKPNAPDSFSLAAAGTFKVNRNQREDLVFQDSANILPFTNSGDGINFKQSAPLAGTPDPALLHSGQIIFADLDGDGNADIIIPYFNLAGATPANPNPQFPNQLYIWYGNGDGSFAAPVITPLARNYYLGTVLDVNGDSRPDLVLSDGYLVSILYNQGNRTFGNETHLLAGQGINQLSLVDVNGDGNPDLIATNGGAVISSPVALGGANPGARSIALPRNPDVDNGGITVLLSHLQSKGVKATLVANPEPSDFGAAFNITATIIPPPVSSNVIPTGNVQFLVDGVVINTVPLSANGSATTGGPTTLAPGLHNLAAIYTGDSNYRYDAAIFGTHTVRNPPIVVPPSVAASAISLTSSLNPSAPGQLITLTASVTIPGPLPLIPTGSVTFLDGTAVLGTATLDNFGVAIFQTSTLAPGSHPLTATYAGMQGTPSGTPLRPPTPPRPPAPALQAPARHPAAVVPPGTTILPSTSPVLTQIVTFALTAEPTGIALTVTPNPVSGRAGRTVLLLVDVRDVSGFSQPVQLSCSGLPVEAACIFVQSVIPAGGGSTTLQLTTSAPHDCGDPGHPYFLGRAGTPGSLTGSRALALGTPIFAGLLLLFLPGQGWRGAWRKHLTRNLLLLVALTGGLSALSGCGHCTDLGTRPGDYTFKVIATPQGGPTTQVQTAYVTLHLGV